MAREHIRFIREWVASPSGIAAIAPSSQALAREITRELHGGIGPVLELGPGTGVFSRAILEAGVAPGDLTMVELNRRFAKKLRRDFPDSHVHCASAKDLSAVSDGGGTYGAVVSALGFLNMPRDVVEDFLDGVFRYLRPGGKLYQFTYGWRVPIPRGLMAEKGIEATRTGIVLQNLPPASVYQIHKSHRH